MLSKIRQSNCYIPWTIFLFFLSFYLITARGNISEADGVINFMTTRSLVETGSLSLPCDFPDVFVARGINDICYSKYGIGLPLISTPLYLVGRFFSEPAPANPDRLSLPRLLVSTLNQFITAATCSILYILGFRMTDNKKRAFELALVFGLFTIAWPYASTNFSQPLIGFLLLASIVLISSPKRSLANSLLAGSFLGAALLVRLDSLPLIMVIYIWALYKARSDPAEFDKKLISQSIITLLPIFVSLAVLGLIQFNHFGSLFQTGYEGEGWSTPFLTGLIGLLFSFGKGVVFYSPLILLALPGLFILYRQGVKDLPLLAILLLVIQLLIYSSWWSWMGGWSWGPRFLVPTLPLLMIGILPWLQSNSSIMKLTFSCLILASFIVQIVGVTTDPIQYFSNREIVEQQFLYNPLVSPIWIQFQFLISKQVSLLIPSNGHGILTPAQTTAWAAVAMLLLMVFAIELVTATRDKI